VNNEGCRSITFADGEEHSQLITKCCGVASGNAMPPYKEMRFRRVLSTHVGGAAEVTIVNLQCMARWEPASCVTGINHAVGASITDRMEGAWFATIQELARLLGKLQRIRAN
jgi:hypothetical protein